MRRAELEAHTFAGRGWMHHLSTFPCPSSREQEAFRIYRAYLGRRLREAERMLLEMALMEPKITEAVRRNLLHDYAEEDRGIMHFLGDDCQVPNRYLASEEAAFRQEIRAALGLSEEDTGGDPETRE